MEKQQWTGVFPAITTPFTLDGAVDYDFLRQHVRWLADNGCRGIVPLGSLGEANTLSSEEKVRILEVCREALDPGVHLVAGIAGLSTQECVGLAKQAAAVGCSGLMVLPPYVYQGDWRETEAHFSAVLRATPLSSMLYNNPIAYGTDVTAEQVALLARHDNLHAVKESSGDARRVTAIREVMGDRIAVFVGLDDMVLEGVASGAVGWIAGLVNALPAESVRLFDLARSGELQEAWELYNWFLPLLRLDTVPKFVQLIKLVQQEVGYGSARVRPPRLELEGRELEEVLTLVRTRLATPIRSRADGRSATRLRAQPLADLPATPAAPR